jgi:hypothetical protein
LDFISSLDTDTERMAKLFSTSLRLMVGIVEWRSE